MEARPSASAESPRPCQRMTGRGLSFVSEVGGEWAEGVEGVMVGGRVEGRRIVSQGCWSIGQAIGQVKIEGIVRVRAVLGRRRPVSGREGRMLVEWRAVWLSGRRMRMRAARDEEEEEEEAIEMW